LLSWLVCYHQGQGRFWPKSLTLATETQLTTFPCSQTHSCPSPLKTQANPWTTWIILPPSLQVTNQCQVSWKRLNFAKSSFQGDVGDQRMPPPICLWGMRLFSTGHNWEEADADVPGR
jgi:hypothetical protein